MGLPGQEREPFERLRKSIQDYWALMATGAPAAGKGASRAGKAVPRKEVLPRRRLVLEMARQFDRLE